MTFHNVSTLSLAPLFISTMSDFPLHTLSSPVVDCSFFLLGACCSGQGLHCCLSTASTLGPDGLGIGDGLSQWSCVFSLWQPNSILYL